MIQQSQKIFNDPVRTIIALRRRHAGGWIPSGIIGNHAIAARKKSDLRLPGLTVTGELVAEHHRCAGAGLFIIDFNPVDSDLGHDAALPLGWLIEGISQIGFRFKVKAGASGNPQAYVSMSGT